MGEFQTSFSAILRNDLKHIYSGMPHATIVRQTTHGPSQEQLLADTRDNNTFVLKSSEFIPEYDCHIPKAPAFRVLSGRDVRNCVTRLTTPHVPSQDSSEVSMRDKKERANSKYMGLQSVDGREMTAIVQRLSKPTESTRMREFQTKTKLTDDM